MTQVIAVVGLAFAVISLTWQVITCAWSGSRVRVDTRFGLYLQHILPGRVQSDQPTFLTDQLVAATAHQGYPGIGGCVWSFECARSYPPGWRTM